MIFNIKKLNCTLTEAMWWHQFTIMRTPNNRTNLICFVKRKQKHWLSQTFFHNTTNTLEISCRQSSNRRQSTCPRSEWCDRQCRRRSPAGSVATDTTQCLSPPPDGAWTCDVACRCGAGPRCTGGCRCRLRRAVLRCCTTGRTPLVCVWRAWLSRASRREGRAFALMHRDCKERINLIHNVSFFLCSLKQTCHWPTCLDATPTPTHDLDGCPTNAHA